MRKNTTTHENTLAGGYSVLYYKEQCDILAHLVRELAGSKATRLIAKKLDLSTQAVTNRFPVIKEAQV